MIMKPNQLVLDVQKMFNNNYIAVEVKMGYPYNNGVRSEVADCEKLTIVCPTLAFEKINVKLPIGTTSVLGEIANGGIPVTFSAFSL